MKKQKRHFHFFCLIYDKTSIRFGICDTQNNEGFSTSYQPKPKAKAYNLYLDLDYSGYYYHFLFADDLHVYSLQDQIFNKIPRDQVLRKASTDNMFVVSKNIQTPPMEGFLF